MKQFTFIFTCLFQIANLMSQENINMIVSIGTNYAYSSPNYKFGDYNAISNVPAYQNAKKTENKSQLKPGYNGDFLVIKSIKDNFSFVTGIGFSKTNIQTTTKLRYDYISSKFIGYDDDPEIGDVIWLVIDDTIDSEINIRHNFETNYLTIPIKTYHGLKLKKQNNLLLIIGFQYIRLLNPKYKDNIYLRKNNIQIVIGIEYKINKWSAGLNCQISPINNLKDDVIFWGDPYFIENAKNHYLNLSVKRWFEL